MRQGEFLRARHHAPPTGGREGPDRALMSPAEVKGNVRRATRGRKAERRDGKRVTKIAVRGGKVTVPTPA